MKYIIIAAALLSITLATGFYQEQDVNEHLNSSSNDLAYSLARSEVEKQVPEGVLFQRVNKIAIQIVSGQNIKYELVYGSENVVKVYEVVVFDQPWTKTLQVSSVKLISESESD